VSWIRDLLASAEKWQTIREALDDSKKTARLCLILFVLQLPFDGWLVWMLLLHRR
jgi:hypothetical protein